MRRIAGLAAIAYVAGVGIENMEVLDAPTLGSPITDIRATYEDAVFGAVTHVAGALALVFYVVFTLALFAELRERGRRDDAWARAGLVGGLVGPLIAAAGLAASVALVADAASFSDDTTRTLHELYLVARMVAGPFMGLFLVGMGVAALRAHLLPPWLVWLGFALGGMLALTPLAAITEEQALEVGAGLAFALDTLWILLAGLSLALGDAPGRAVFVRRAAFLVLVIAAALVGIALLAAPGATGTFFAWGLGPEPLAAFAGGVYVGAAALYAVGLFQPWRRVRGLVTGAIVLSVSVLIVTLVHLDEFDFDRLQAWAWLVLFIAFSAVSIGLAVTGGRDEPDETPRSPLPAPARLALAAVAALLGVLAIALWIDPTGLSDESPFTLSPLGGGFAACWVALLATLAGWAALRNDAEEARLPALGLVLLPAGALVAALRTVADLESLGGYIAVLAGLMAVGIWFLAVARAFPDNARSSPLAPTG